MTSSGAPQNTDSIHRIAAAPGKTDRILPADAPARPKPKLPDQLPNPMNTLKAIILIAATSGLLMVVGYFIARGKGVVIAMAISVAMIFSSYW